jgi:hypothetical protein
MRIPGPQEVGYAISRGEERPAPTSVSTLPGDSPIKIPTDQGGSFRRNGVLLPRPQLVGVNDLRALLQVLHDRSFFLTHKLNFGFG